MFVVKPDRARDEPTRRPTRVRRAVEKEMKHSQFPFAFRMIQQYLNSHMFDAIKAQLTTAGEKLAHMRRFL